MAHGLEGRTPFLDVELAKTLFRLPDDMKLSGDVGKWLLREWLDQRLPVARAFERKRGFTVPVAEWIAEQGARLGPLIEAQPAIRAICRPGRVAPLYRARGKHAGFAGWTLLFYALWHRRHILGLAPVGDVFETLAATPSD
jgi:asparagine synthase (glutamine-hydrolysing)